MKKPSPIRYEKAIELMRRPGARLLRMHNRSNGVEYYVEPGGPVEPATAVKIMDHPNVRGGADGLFPGLEQTWRMIRTYQEEGAQHRNLNSIAAENERAA
jgi:hypothetical protein